MTDVFAELEAAARDPGLIQAPTDDQSSRVTKLGQELWTIEDRLAKYKVVAAALEERRQVIMRSELVDAMDAIGQDRMGLAEHGVDIVTKNYYHASLPSPSDKDAPEEAERKAELRRRGLEWLAEEGFDGVINTVLMVKMPKGSLEIARKMREAIGALFGSQSTPESRAAYAEHLLNYLNQRNEPGIDPGSASVEEGVHWATLTSLIREQTEVAKRTDLPTEILGATIGRIAEIVKRKTSKKGK